jgi:hypothetical protein
MNRSYFTAKLSCYTQSCRKGIDQGEHGDNNNDNVKNLVLSADITLDT